LRVAEGAESARDRGEDEREDDRRPGARPIGAARRGGPDGGEDAGADDRSDAERGEIEGSEGSLESDAALGVAEEMVEALGAEQPSQHRPLMVHVAIGPVKPTANRSPLLESKLEAG